MLSMSETHLYMLRYPAWRVVLLAPRSKRPQGITWQITQDPNVARHHWSQGGNLGLVCGPESNVIVLDFDRPGILEEMSRELGPILPWVRTGSDKHHCYFKWQEGLPAKMMWRGEKVGEIQRGPALQHVVMPPSVHPDTGRDYVWLHDAQGTELTDLPEAWQRHLKEDVIPSFIPVGDRTGHPEPEPWLGPPPEELLRRAAMQPGARHRRNGIKMQCPGCRKIGRDRSMDNALVGLDGRWGCAVDPSHSRDIGEVLGVVSLSREVLGDDEDDLREPTIDDLD